MAVPSTIATQGPITVQKTFIGPWTAIGLPYRGKRLDYRFAVAVHGSVTVQPETFPVSEEKRACWRLSQL